MNKEYKQVDIKMDSFDAETGIFEGYGSTFGNKDLGGDIVVKGAFSKCLASKDLHDIDMLYSHDGKEIIGEFILIHEDEKGLKFKGQLYLKNIQRADEVYFLMQKGKLKSMSIGYYTLDSEYDGKARMLKELELVEISVVRHPMNPEADITGVKQVTRDDLVEVKSLSDIEKLLQKQNISNRASTDIIAMIMDFKKLSTEGEPHAEDSVEPSEGEPHQELDGNKTEESIEAHKGEDESYLDTILAELNNHKGL